MTIDRTPKPCQHKRADHQHGTYVCYTLDRCRCFPCAYAASTYHQQRKRRNAYGRSNYVDAQPVRQHVTELMAAGVGLKRIVAVSGVPQGALWKLVYGKRRSDGTQVVSQRVTTATADRLLALDPADRDLLAGGARVDPTGTTRRLQALACLGWSIRRLADELAVDRQPLDRALAGHAVAASSARAIAAAYERLWASPPTPADRFSQAGITRTVNQATAAGWAPPLAWDDDTIDDPAAVPAHGIEALIDEVAVDEVLAGRAVPLSRTELAVAVQRLTDRGQSAAEIAERLGTYQRKVTRIRARNALTHPATPDKEIA